MERCAGVERNSLGPWAFESIRYTPSGTPDPTCVFNQTQFKDASILVAGPNFGCGSSREMAVWALAGMGIRSVIAPSFGPIFHANCFQNGMLPICLPLDIVETLLQPAATGHLVLDIDLPNQTVCSPTGEAFRFDIEPLRKSMLMKGLDEITLSLQHEAAIAAWQQRDRESRPWIYTPGLTFESGGHD